MGFKESDTTERLNLLVAQLVKNPLAMRETWVRSLGWEDSLEEGMATHSSILAWKIPRDRGAWRATVHGVTKSQTQLKQFNMHQIEYEKEYISMYYVCTTELPRCTTETNTRIVHHLLFHKMQYLTIIRI